MIKLKDDYLVSLTARNGRQIIQSAVRRGC